MNPKSKYVDYMLDKIVNKINNENKFATNKKDKDNILVKYKIIKLDTCPYCKEAKKLLEDNGISFEYKGENEMTEEEKKIIKDTVGEYKYFPKIFKLNSNTNKYEFIKGFKQLEQLNKENKLF